MINDVAVSRELAWRIAVRNISAMYRQTYFGFFWAVIPPLATTAVFLLLRAGGITNTDGISYPSYAAFLLISTCIWQLFADSVSAPLRVVTTSRQMLVKINFPREALLFASVLETLFGFAIRLLIIIGVMVWYGLWPPMTVFLVPIGLLALMGAGFAVGILLTPIGVWYQDISKVLPMLLNAWMLLTPVVYAAGSEGVRGELSRWNPISPLMTATRDWLLTGPSTFTLEFVLVFAITLLLLGFGWLLYRVAMPHVIARLGG